LLTEEGNFKTTNVCALKAGIKNQKSESSGTGMAFPVDFQQLGQIEMSVLLSGGQALVTQEFLNDP
jgi:hypothetical protein